MAEVWGIAAATVVSAGVGAASARSAARAGQRGANAANAEQARQYDTTRADFRPQRELGQGATSMLGRLYGIPIQNDAQARASEPMLVGDTELPAGTTTRSVGNGYYEVLYGGNRIGTLEPGGPNGRFVNDTGVDIGALFKQQGDAQAATTGSGAGPDMSVFFESPDYRFNLAEGESALNRSLAARGRTLSGAGVKEGVRYASGMASQQFGDFYNRLTNLAGLGQAATQSTAAAGMNAANNISQNHMYAGQARANGYMQTGQAVNNGVQGGISNYMLMQYLNKPPVT